MNDHTIIRFPTVIQRSGYARRTLYDRIQAGLWTKPIKLTKKAVGWPTYEVDQLIDAHIAGNSREQIQNLVKKLHADRRNLANILPD